MPSYPYKLCHPEPRGEGPPKQMGAKHAVDRSFAKTRPPAAVSVEDDELVELLLKLEFHNKESSMSFTEIFGSNKPRCQHVSDDGKRCAADPQTNNKFCFMHDPGQKEKQAKARKKGGQMRFQPYEPKMPASFQYTPLQDRAQISDFLDQLGLYLQRGEMDQRNVRSYLFLASLKLSVCKDEAAERRWAERRAERQTQKAGKEPKFFEQPTASRRSLSRRAADRRIPVKQPPSRAHRHPSTRHNLSRLPRRAVDRSKPLSRHPIATSAKPRWNATRRYIPRIDS